MWTSTVGLVNGKHRYLTAETFGFKINSNGQVLKKRQQWTIEPFPENLGPDGSISSAASVSSQAAGIVPTSQQLVTPAAGANQQHCINQAEPNNDPCILTFSPAPICSSLTSVKSSSNGSSNASDQDVCGEEHENVAIKSHLNKYLAVDSFGNVTCDSDEKTENARFTITICSMSQGKSKDEHIFWAFKNVERGYYLGTTDDGMVCCNAKMPKSRAELWHLHLIPARGASFFALKSLGRRRFARVASDDLPFARQAAESNGDGVAADSGSSQVQLDSTISWGPETLFQFKYYEGGRYSLLTSDCKLLTNEGKCISWSGPAHDESSYPPPECLFTLEYHSGFLAFRDSFSHYLAAAGRSSVLRSRSIGVSRDELFAFEPAPIQVSFKATFNNRWVSIKQGVDLSANQTDTSPKYETFQLTYHKQTRNWSIMTQDCNFWTVLHNTGTVSVCKPGDYEGLTRGQFRLIWSETDASFSLQFIETNSQQQQQPQQQLEPKWISARKSGQLFLSNGTQPPVQFIMRFQNRRLLNLRPVEGSGFVGIRPGVNSKQLDANKTSPDSFAIEYPELPASSSLFEKTIPTSKCIPPQVGPKPSFMVNNHNNNNNNQQSVESSATTVNLFNVKLNSTKLGKTMLEQQNNGTIISDPSKILASSQIHENGTKEIDCCDRLDDNNNSEQPAQIGPESSKQDDGAGSVESGSAPSVASIINSFSNVKLANKSASPSATVNKLSSQQHRIGSTSSTARLASAFSGQQQQHLNSREESDIASVITSCSSTSSASSNAAALQSSSSASAGQEIASCLVRTCDQLAQLECCYLKTICNDRYLVVNDKESGVSCEATNKACAQSWIIELRSHNSIAIRASDNHAYMQLGTNGTIFLSRCEPKDATLWEF